MVMVSTVLAAGRSWPMLCPWPGRMELKMLAVFVMEVVMGRQTGARPPSFPIMPIVHMMFRVVVNIGAGIIVILIIPSRSRRVFSLAT